MSLNINNPKFHTYYNCRNTNFKWWCTDSQETYQHNLTHRKNELEENEWIDKEIVYSINSEGFRCPEFDDNSCIMFLGNSITAGIGVEYEKIYPTMVSRVLGLTCANISMPGGSIDTSFRLALHWIPKLKPKIVVLDVGIIDRIELLTTDRAINYLPSGYNTSTFYTEYILTEENSFLNYKKNMLAILKLCEINNVKFIETQWGRPAKDPNDNLYGLEWVRPKFNKKGRDLIHPGKYNHLSKSLSILDQIVK